jgi:hypothetical protein
MHGPPFEEPIRPPIGADNLELTAYGNAQAANQIFGPGYTQTQIAAAGVEPGTLAAYQIAANAAVQAQGAIQQLGLAGPRPVPVRATSSSRVTSPGHQVAPQAASPPQKVPPRIEWPTLGPARHRAPPPTRWQAYWAEFRAQIIGVTVGLTAWYGLWFSAIPVWWNPIALLPAAVYLFIVVEDVYL